MTLFAGHQLGAAFCVYYVWVCFEWMVATHSFYMAKAMAMNIEHDVLRRAVLCVHAAWLPIRLSQQLTV